MNEGFLLPQLDEYSAAFWEGTRVGELRMQTCASCGKRRFPPRPMCPWCRSIEFSWPAMSGRGTIWSYVVPHPPLLPAYAELAPYNVIVVALDEDPALRLVGNLVADATAGIGSVDPASIEIGAAVRAVYQPLAEDITLPRWVLA
jgi:uncharacterized OB-fold protein